MELLIGSQNPGKVREYRYLLQAAPVTVIGLMDKGLGEVDVEETGDTFLANAELKARTYAELSGLHALADDSGLCVDALDGRPGLYSARYGDPSLDDAGRRALLLSQMVGVPEGQRSARFVCAIAVVDPATGQCLTVEGTCEGQIAFTEQDGPEGFGYDALFIPDGHNRTFAAFSKEEKNRISHRGDAAQRLIPLLRQLVQERGG